MKKTLSGRTSSKKKSHASFDTALLAAKGAEAKKSEDIVIIDLRETSSICDYIVICSAASAPQIKAVTRSIDEILEKRKIKVPSWQGVPSSNWMILDLFDVVVHVTNTEERSKYNIEGLWGKSCVTYHV